MAKYSGRSLQIAMCVRQLRMSMVWLEGEQKSCVIVAVYLYREVIDVFTFGVAIVFLQFRLWWYSWPRSHAQMVLDNILNPSVIEAGQNRSSVPVATHLNRKGEAVG
jgi:hypothetical protein